MTRHRRMRGRAPGKRAKTAAGRGKGRGKGKGSGRRGVPRRGWKRRHRPAGSAPAVREDGSARTSAGSGYEEGYREGLYDGGERLLEAALPDDRIVPDLTLAEVVAAGVPLVLSRSLRLLGPAELCAALEEALADGRPFSLVRLGDGELLTLSQDTLKSAEEIARESPFLAYAGVDAPDLAARDVLAAAIHGATVVGVPLSRRPNYQPLLFEALRRNRISPESLRMTSSTVNYALYESGHLMRLIAGKRIVVVGNAAEALARALLAAHVQVVHAVAPVNGINDSADAVRRTMAVPFDLALVSAGVAAVPICVELAERTGKAAIDFGHMADRLGSAEPVSG